jgi:hypothetical protein
MRAAGEREEILLHPEAERGTLALAARARLATWRATVCSHLVSLPLFSLPLSLRAKL